MTDIVERLRDMDDLDRADVLAPLCHKAADEIERLRAALESLTIDPPPTFAREPDTDAEVITKMRWIARRALEPKP